MGIISDIIVLVGLLWGGVLWLRGIVPVVLRLGNGLARRKIAIFAKGDHVISLKDLLLDSKLFKKKNIYEITSGEDFGRSEEATVFLVYWHDWTSENINQILNQKRDKCALIVYAPYNCDRIPSDMMTKLDGERNTAVTNFRGRLLSDIIGSMITISYER